MPSHSAISSEVPLRVGTPRVGARAGSSGGDTRHEQVLQIGALLPKPLAGFGPEAERRPLNRTEECPLRGALSLRPPLRSIRTRCASHVPACPSPQTLAGSDTNGEGERLVVDAVLHYTATDSEHRRRLRAFVEVDRTTMSSERLAVKVIECARPFQYEAQPLGRRRTASTGPAWLRWYAVFPRVLFILTGAHRTQLEDPISDLQAMTTQHPLVATLAREAPLGASILEDIEKHGPSAPVWTPREPRPWTNL